MRHTMTAQWRSVETAQPEIYVTCTLHALTVSTSTDHWTTEPLLTGASLNMPELDRGHYGGVGHRSARRRLDGAFDVDTLEKARTKAREVPACRRDGAPVPLFLAAHDPLRVLAMRTKWNEGYAR